MKIIEPQSDPSGARRSLTEKHGEAGWSPDKFQRPAVDGGDQTIPDVNGRLSGTCEEFSP